VSTTLAEEYERQRAWRPWGRIFEALPPFAGRTVLDLGCGPGDLAAELVARGARVIGFDANEELVRAARARGLAGARFELADMRALPRWTSRRTACGAASPARTSPT
jgi:trans-aconitate methyltransferase